MHRYLENFINILNPRAPKGLIRSAEQWVATRKFHNPQMRRPQPSAYYKNIIHHEENIHLTNLDRGRTPDDEFQNVRWTLSEECGLYYLKDCRILGDEGVVISPDNKVFCEFNYPPNCRWLEHSCFRRKRIPNVKKIDGWYATLVYPESRFFFHWMLESLPRASLLKEYISLLDGIFVPGQLQKYHLESLDLLGIDRSKLIAVDVHSHYQPEHLFVPKYFSLFNPPKWLNSWFKEEFLSEDGERHGLNGKGKKIYVSRDDAPARKVENENEVVSWLKESGFEVVYLTEHSFLEQACIFHEAEVIVAPHGAGLSNLVFCKHDTKIIEIFPPQWMPPCFMVLASSVGCIYEYIIGEDVRVSGNPDPQKDNIIIPIDILQLQLKSMSISTTEVL